ncbi:MAG: 4Fe-4S binding protein, partial [Victivallaceae bacterium]
FRVMKTQDTPEYFDQALAARERYLEITPAMPETALPHVTGATFSSSGISKTLQLTARRFLAAGQGKSASARSATPRIPLTAAGVALALFIIAAHVVRYYPSARRRTFFLAAVVLLFGFMLQIQFSTATLAALAFWNLPDAGLSGTFLLVAALPMVMLFSGNLYCGWLCPFGALQELAGQLNRSRFYYRPPKKLWLLVRQIKYFILAGLLIALLLTLNPGVLDMDLLNHAFSRNPGVISASMALLVLVISFFTPRFWCRNLCPAGAFLAFFNRVRLVNLIKGKNKKAGWNPVIHPGRCDMGIAKLTEADCLNCDRCRMAGTEKLKDKNKAGKAGMIYLTACILLGAAVLFPGFRALAASVPQPAEKIVVAAGANSAANPAEVRYKDGVYTGKAKGYDTSKDISVQITVKNGRIINVKVLECCDDSPQSALTDIPNRIIAAQSTEKIDAVTGATFTSKGIMNAVKNALAAAPKK